jgi:cellulose synthase operon protein C
MYERSLLAAPLVLMVLMSGCSGDSATDLIAKAKVELAQRDPAAAVIHLKNALDQDPASAEARLLLGRTLLATGDVPQALIELRKALNAQAPEDEVMPEIARAWLAQGEAAKLVAAYGGQTLTSPAANARLRTLVATAQASLGDVDGSRHSLAQALESQPRHAPALVLNARLDAATGQVEAALRQLDEVLAGEPGHEAAGLLKADILWQVRRDADEAAALYRRVRAAHPKSLGAHRAMVRLLLQQGQLAAARTDFTALQKLAPMHPDTVFLQGQLALAGKDYKAAREICDRLLSAAPKNVGVLLLAGAAEMGMARHTQAAGLFDRALKVAPGLVPARQMLAHAWMTSGQPDKALDVLQPVVDAPEADARSLAMAGEAWLMTGQGARAEALFQRALRVAPDDAGLRTGMAVAQLARGENGAAEQTLQAIAQIDSSSRADLAVISARLRQNDLPGALKAIAALERKRPEQALPLVLRGRVQRLQGDLAAARASLDQALVRQPGFLPAMTMRADLDVADHQPAAARQRFETAIKADPQNNAARLALVDLDRRLGAPDAALVAQLKDAVRADPSDPASRRMLVEQLLASGDAQAAQMAAQEATAALPNDLWVMDALGRAQLAAGDSERAVSTFKQLATQQPKNPLHLVRLADAHIARQDSAAAAQALRRALEIEPDHLLAQRGLALLAQRDRRPQDALAIARGLQQRLPRDAVGFALEGELEARAGHWPAAAAAMGQALQRQPRSELAIQQHAYLVRAGRSAEAERLSTSWQKAHPQDAAFLYHLGNLALSAQDWPQAEARYRGVLKLQPRHAAAANNIAWIMATQHRDGAVAMAEQALAIAPDRPAMLDTLALAQESAGQLAQAVHTQKRAVELNPRDPSLRLRLAQLHLKNGDTSDARDLLEPLSRLGPSFSGHAEALGLLKSL